MSKQIDLVVIGGANTDYLVRSKELPRPGETVQGNLFYEGIGGKGANQAVAAARLGVNVGLIAKVGRDSRGQAIVDKLEREGVNINCLLRDAHSMTGVALISVCFDGEKQITVAPGANNNLFVSDIYLMKSIIESAKILLLQLEIPLNTVRAAIEIAHQAGVPIILDPAPAIPLPTDLLEMVDVIRPNSKEAEVLTHIPATDYQSAFKAARKLLSFGVKTAIVQAGTQGDVLLTQSGKERWFPRFQVNSIDATGAGDAFLGTLAAFILENKSIEEAAIYASASAALKTTSIGAQSGLPKRTDIEDLLKNSKNYSSEAIHGQNF